MIREVDMDDLSGEERSEILGNNIPRPIDSIRAIKSVRNEESVQEAVFNCVLKSEKKWRNEALEENLERDDVQGLACFFQDGISSDDSKVLLKEHDFHLLNHTESLQRFKRKPAWRKLQKGIKTYNNDVLGMREDNQLSSKSSSSEVICVYNGATETRKESTIVERRGEEPREEEETKEQKRRNKLFQRKEEELKRKQDEMVKEKKKLDVLKKELRKKETRMNENEKELKKKRRLNEQLEQLNYKMEERLEKEKEELGKKKEELGKREEELGKKEEELGKKKEELGKKEEELRGKEEELREKEHALTLKAREGMKKAGEEGRNEGIGMKRAVCVKEEPVDEETIKRRKMEVEGRFVRSETELRESKRMEMGNRERERLQSEQREREQLESKKMERERQEREMENKKRKRLVIEKKQREQQAMKKLTSDLHEIRKKKSEQQMENKKMEKMEQEEKKKKGEESGDGTKRRAKAHIQIRETKLPFLEEAETGRRQAARVSDPLQPILKLMDKTDQSQRKDHSLNAAKLAEHARHSRASTPFHSTQKHSQPPTPRSSTHGRLSGGATPTGSNPNDTSQPSTPMYPFADTSQPSIPMYPSHASSYRQRKPSENDNSRPPTPVYTEPGSSRPPAHTFSNSSTGPAGLATLSQYSPYRQSMPTWPAYNYSGNSQPGTPHVGNSQPGTPHSYQGNSQPGTPHVGNSQPGTPHSYQGNSQPGTPHVGNSQPGTPHSYQGNSQPGTPHVGNSQAGTPHSYQGGEAESIRRPLPKKIPKWKTLSEKAGMKSFRLSFNPSTYIVSRKELLQSAAEGNMEEVARFCTNLNLNLDFGSFVDGRTNFFHELMSVRWTGSEGSCIGCLNLLLIFDLRCGPIPREGLHKTLDFVDEEGNTPLHIAARKRNLTAVRTLLQLGAAPALLNTRNESPMLIAMRDNERSIMEELYNHGANLPPLFREKVFADKLASRFEKKFAEARNLLNRKVTELKPLEALFQMKGKAQHVFHISNQQGALESLKGNRVFFVLYCCEVIVNIKNPSLSLYTCQDASPFSQIPFITTGHDDTQQHPLVAYRKNDKPELSMAYFIPTELMVRGAFKLNFRLCENEIRRHILAQILLVKEKE